MKVFLHQYDEGYDLHHDEHYNWLKTFHPAEDTSLSTVAIPPSMHNGRDLGGPVSRSESATAQRMAVTRSKVTLNLESGTC